MTEAAIAQLATRIADFDIALDILRAWLPGHGVKLVIPPPATGNISPAYASLWRRGDARTVSHKGATPSLALLLAAESELVTLRDACEVAACDLCRGVGVFVSKTGSVEICRHAERRNFLIK